MSVSIRNQIAGTVTVVTSGAAMATVKIRLVGGPEVTAAVTVESINDLDLAEGSQVRIMVKSTEVALATGPVSGLSIRNRIPGTIVAIDEGDAMAVVKLVIDGGDEITAAITKAAVVDLGLDRGVAVTALIKSTEISIASL
ncbi:TOBE domain-containing protein [Frankia sp. Cas3]|uniref:TOBE domain-containing protein n=1 Tax=Frankia sp. Cas3 TaxID=3073926 RepID=UPI002AD38478|nr:TOBE domain-containing protein [Frankia sp. Cas3]